MLLSRTGLRHAKLESHATGLRHAIGVTRNWTQARKTGVTHNWTQARKTGVTPTLTLTTAPTLTPTTAPTPTLTPTTVPTLAPTRAHPHPHSPDVEVGHVLTLVSGALIGSGHARQHADERGLARPVLSQHHNDFTVRELAGLDL